MFLIFSQQKVVSCEEKFYVLCEVKTPKWIHNILLLEKKPSGKHSPDMIWILYTFKVDKIQPPSWSAEMMKPELNHLISTLDLNFHPALI